VKSAKAKMARSKCVFPHTMGRHGYAHVKEKMVDQGTDSMTLVLGKEKGGYAKGVRSRVTYKRYFDLPRSKQAADERILLLESQLDAARREREEKELLIKNIHPVNSSADEEGGTTVETVKSMGAKYTTRSIRKDSLSQDSQSKRKNIYISSDAMQKEANKKRSQKALVY
ncbi:hypothetical protein Tco_1197229, partial [Tanacetum coccineum]